MFAPTRPGVDFTRLGRRTYCRWHGVVVATVPTRPVLLFFRLTLVEDEERSGFLGHERQKPLEFIRIDLGRQGAPAVAVAEEDDEVRLGRELLTAFEFLPADIHCLLIECRLLADTPAKVNRLEPGPTLLAVLP